MTVHIREKPAIDHLLWLSSNNDLGSLVFLHWKDKWLAFSGWVSSPFSFDHVILHQNSIIYEFQEERFPSRSSYDKL